MIGLERSPYNKINIHCNGVYGDKKAWIDSVKTLSYCESVKAIV